MADEAVHKEKTGSFGADISAGAKTDILYKKGKKRAPPSLKSSNWWTAYRWT